MTIVIPYIRLYPRIGTATDEDRKAEYLKREESINFFEVLDKGLISNICLSHQDPAL